MPPSPEKGVLTGNGQPALRAIRQLKPDHLSRRAHLPNILNLQWDPSASLNENRRYLLLRLNRLLDLGGVVVVSRGGTSDNCGDDGGRAAGGDGAGGGGGGGVGAQRGAGAEAGEGAGEHGCGMRLRVGGMRVLSLCLCDFGGG